MPLLRRRQFRLDGDQLASMYRAHAPDLLGYLLRRTLDREVALDLLAETFAQAFEDRRQFRGSSREAAVGWLYGIARHQLSGYFRRGSAERRALQRLGVEPPQWVDADIERFENLAELATLRSRVGELLGDLAEEQRRALALRVVSELPYPDVAAELGISEQTARARVSRALRQLGASLENDDLPDLAAEAQP